MKVSLTTLVGLCGVASVATGVLWTAGTLVNYATGGSLGPSSIPGAAIGLATHTMMVFAFLGIFALQSRPAGFLGVLGSVVGIVGATLIVGEIAIASARLAGAVEIVRPPLVIGAPATLSLMTGVLLTGLATIRAGVVARWSGLPFVISVVLALLTALRQEFGVLAIVTASSGFIWIGWTVWRVRGSLVSYVRQ